MIRWDLHRFHTDSELAAALGEAIRSSLQAGLEARGQASLAVSGGSTPARLFTELSEAALDWPRVTVTLVDERWVDEQHADSNARLVRNLLLKGRAKGAQFIGLKNSQPDPFSAVPQVDDALSRVPLPLDAVVLGMGEDGHTASFFSGAQGVREAMDPASPRRCAGVLPLHASHARMTLTLPVILAARNLFLHLIGEEKMAVFEQLVGSDDELEAPVKTVLKKTRKPCQVYFAERNI